MFYFLEHMTKNHVLSLPAMVIVMEGAKVDHETRRFEWSISQLGRLVSCSMTSTNDGGTFKESGMIK